MAPPLSTSYGTVPCVGQSYTKLAGYISVVMSVILELLGVLLHVLVAIKASYGFYEWDK